LIHLSDGFPTGAMMDTHSTMGKDVGLRIRLEKTLRDEFVAACHANDRPAAQILRDFMRSYVSQNEQKTGNDGQC
jgi:hypothetical protein